jgi:NAD-specific glutamate dehydrogenase
MFHILKTTQRSSAQALAIDLHSATEQLAQVQSDANEMRAELDRLAKETSLKDELIRRLQDLRPITPVSV